MAVEAVAGARRFAVSVDEDAGARPTERLPLRQLFQLSFYWLGINTIMGGLGVVVQKQIPALVPAPWDGPAIALQSVLTMLMAAAIQPTIGALSDYTISRWGRRKPYIAIGATLDVAVPHRDRAVELVPRARRVPDRRPVQLELRAGAVPGLRAGPRAADARSRSRARSSGSCRPPGSCSGTIIITYGVTTDDYLLPLVFLGVIELATAIGTILWVSEGRAARDRQGRSWRAIARSAWGTDILKERSFLNLVISRLMFLAGINMLLGFYILFMERSLLIPPTRQGFWIPVTAGPSSHCSP